MEEHDENNSENHSKRYLTAKYFVFWILVGVVVFGVYRVGYERGQHEAWGDDVVFPVSDTAIISSGDESKTLDFSLFWRTWSILEKKYVDAGDLDAREMMYGAIEGMLRSTGDPYTTFFDPEENKSFEEGYTGEFEGIGAELEMRDELITVVAPLSGTPADRAGLRPEDIIIEVDGEDVTDETLTEAVGKIRGPKDTEVVLTVVREGERDTLEIPIVRDTIEVKSVEWEMNEDIAIVSIRIFGPDMAVEFRRALQEIRARGAKSMVIDLRNNPGGSLQVAKDMGDILLPPGEVIVIQQDRSGKREETAAHSVAESEYARSLPTVVLINRGSASASEILAGALKAHRDNVTLVGETSFGKGSVQELVPLPQKTAAKITIAKWLTPSGEQIDEVGIEPDVIVERTEEDFEADRDPQMERALEEVGNMEPKSQEEE